MLPRCVVGPPEPANPGPHSFSTADALAVLASNPNHPPPQPSLTASLLAQFGGRQAAPGAEAPATRPANSQVDQSSESSIPMKGFCRSSLGASIGNACASKRVWP